VGGGQDQVEVVKLKSVGRWKKSGNERGIGKERREEDASKRGADWLLILACLTDSENRKKVKDLIFKVQLWKKKGKEGENGGKIEGCSRGKKKKANLGRLGGENNRYKKGTRKSCQMAIQRKRSSTKILT